MSKTPSSEPVYVLGRSHGETARLQAQALLLEPLTESLFRDAGIRSGMKVLDLGAGAGDVAMLAARLVGPMGSVLGVDANAAILETARVKAHEAGYRNVSFQQGDIQQLDLDQDFDAIVGRYIMMYMPAPQAVMRAVASHLRHGGIAAFQECDWTQSPYAIPSSPLLDQVWKWIRAAFEESGADTKIGPKLRQLFLGAGLADPQLHGDRWIGGGANWGGYEHMANLVRSVLPFLEASRIATAEQIGIDSLCDRLRQEIVRQNGVVIYHTLVRAWAHKP